MTAIQNTVMPNAVDGKETQHSVAIDGNFCQAVSRDECSSLDKKSHGTRKALRVIWPLETLKALLGCIFD